MTCALQKIIECIIAISSEIKTTKFVEFISKEMANTSISLCLAKYFMNC